MVCGLALVCGSATAQPGMGGGMMGGGMPPMGGGMMMGGFGGFGGGAVDMAPLAVFQTEQLAKDLNLTDQQVKKIRKIYKKELDRRMNHYLANGTSGGFGGMMGGGMPPMGGGMMGGGMPPMGGGMPPMGGGFPGGGSFGGFPGMGDAQAAPAEEDTDSPELKAAKQAYERLEQMEETNADLKAKIKIEKKMMKILDAEQYSKWSAIQNRTKGMPAPNFDGAEFDLNNIPEEYREQFLERMKNGRPEEAPQGFPPQGQPQN